MTDFGAIYDAVNEGGDHLTDEGRAAEAGPYKPCWDIHEGVPVPPGRCGPEPVDMVVSAPPVECDQDDRQWWTRTSELWAEYDEARGPVVLGAAYRSLVTGEDVVVDGHDMGPVLKAEDVTPPGAAPVSLIDMIKRDDENGGDQ